MLPTQMPSEMPKKPIINDPHAPRAETITIGAVDSYADTIDRVRIMITMAIGTLKEVMSQVREKPGARFLIGEILGCLGHAKKATMVKPEQLQFNKI